MSRFPPSIERLIEEFKRLPGIGEKTAERFVFHLLRRGREACLGLAEAVYGLEKNVRVCSACQSVSESDPCPLCRDPSRRADQLCVVADHQSLSAVERTGAYRGRYYVLGGLISPIEGITPETLGIEKLDDRLRSGRVEEIILAVNPTIEGEATINYLSRRYAAAVPKITRLARGLPRGADLEYADEVTVSDALTGRRDVVSHKP